jgi:hypothetical protein
VPLGGTVVSMSDASAMRLPRFRIRAWVIAVVTRLDCSHGFQQRHYGLPLDVVAGRMLKDLQERVAVMVVEVRRF